MVVTTCGETTGAAALGYEERLDYYTGGRLTEGSPKATSITLSADTDCTVSSTEQTFDMFVDSLPAFAGNAHLAGRANLAPLFERYVEPIQYALSELGRDGLFRVMVGDNQRAFGLPTLVKAVRIDRRNRDTFILPLNQKRHFEPLLQLFGHDGPFADKTARIVWRGATTSSFRETSRYYVWKNFEKLQGPSFDIGFSGIVQLQNIERNAGVSPTELERCVKPRLSQVQMLQYKYLLSLEGNDVASGLKWMLGSNSLVLMPPPTCTSWACEVFLEPYRHYVPVREDLSDLQEKFEWCEANPRLVEEIVANATEFMQPFLDQEQERRLVRDVVQTYVDSVEFDVPDEFRHLFFP